MVALVWMLFREENQVSDFSWLIVIRLTLDGHDPKNKLYVPYWPWLLSSDTFSVQVEIS